MVRDDHNKAWLDRRGLAAVVGRHIQSAIIEGEFQPQVFFLSIIFLAFRSP